jgi:hypothetical protein
VRQEAVFPNDWHGPAKNKQTNAEILLPWTEKLLPRPLFG